MLCKEDQSEKEQTSVPVCGSPRLWGGLVKSFDVIFTERTMAVYLQLAHTASTQGESLDTEPPHSPSTYKQRTFKKRKEQSRSGAEEENHRGKGRRGIQSTRVFYAGDLKIKWGGGEKKRPQHYDRSGLTMTPIQSVDLYT